MMAPIVSVLLPVFNGARYLRQSIDSILVQTFPDFELLILNDGSTDNSEEIILSYNDPRIIYTKNETNSGLIFTLNKGIDLARGKYIARIDSDDICLPHRFEKQVGFLQDSHAAVVATTVQMIDENGHGMAPWSDDRNYISAESIRGFLPKNNCIAHPSIMADASVLKEYKYADNQKEAEDYDLWLRLSADGKIISKIDEPLLQYRVLASSLSRKDKLSAAERLARTKGKFLAARSKDKKVNEFVMKVAFYYTINKATAIIKKFVLKK
ncbi:MAG: glycosyl transferase family 2 [Flaviaesturariibacter sp.]|nr:glycosyl transferase family 2 [Flaviaesturariibacter sp.]